MTDKPLPRPDADIETDVRAIIRSREGLRDDEPVWSDLAVRALLRRLDALRVAAPSDGLPDGLDCPFDGSRATMHAANCGHSWAALTDKDRAALATTGQPVAPRVQRAIDEARAARAATEAPTDPRAGTTCADCGHTFEAHLLGVVCCDCVGFLAATEQPETDEVWGQNPNTGNHGRRR